VKRVYRSVTARHQSGRDPGVHTRVLQRGNSCREGIGTRSGVGTGIWVAWLHLPECRRSAWAMRGNRVALIPLSHNGDDAVATMRALRIHAFGGPERLRIEDIAVPVAGADELLVRVKAASLNPVDFKTREGHFPPVRADMLPITLGRDISGTVAGGNAGGFREGDAVMAMLSPERGAFAEYAVARPSQIAVKPDRLPHVQAACVPLAGLTAWQGLFDHGKLQAGQSVLIHGGAGGVGHLAVQFAKLHGATVFATAGTDNQDFLHQLGVDQPIDYRLQRFEDVAQGVDLVLDLIGGETQARSFASLKPGGALISTVAEPPTEQCAAHGVRGARFMAAPVGSQLGEIARLLDEGRVVVTVSETFAFDRAIEAMQRLEQGGVRGKLALELA
jgi:NADPH:quinone reductase-like Zn-dependent oxidoreductase